MSLTALPDPAPRRGGSSKRQRADAESLLQSTSARYLLVNSNLQVLVTSADVLSPRLFTAEEVSALTAEVDSGRRALPRLVLSTAANGTVFCAFHLRGAADAFADGFFANVLDITDALPRVGRVAGHARALFAFHAAHRFCGACGGVTAAETGGARRRCTTRRCAAVTHPRTDPIVVLLIVSRTGDRALLARKRHYLRGEFRCLSGHIEHGEGVDDAVRRKAFEHFGIGIAEVRWLGSHPWPYPYCLMMGFVARATEDELVVDYRTIDDARWFTQEELANLEVSRQAPLRERDGDGGSQGSTPSTSKDDAPRSVPAAPSIIGQLIRAFVQGDDICKFPQ